MAWKLIYEIVSSRFKAELLANTWSEFHIEMDLGKNDFRKEFVRQKGCWML